MKVCGNCQLEKPFSDYTLKYPGVYQSRCKVCVRSYGRQHYIDNKSLYVARNHRHLARRREWYNDLKSGPCLDCGGSFPSCVMEFDHREGETKEFSLSQVMAEKLVSKKRVLAEIAKCDLVCANCHRLRTCQRDHRHHARKA